MLPSLFDSTPIPLLEQVVNFTESRHGVLAGNIANLDTPGYRTRDLSPEMFQERLKEAVESRRARPETERFQYGFDDGFSGYGDYGPLSRSDLKVDEGKFDDLHEVSHSFDGMLRHDENNVGMEKQVNEMVKNQVAHNLAISVMTAQMRLLRAAITERVA